MARDDTATMLPFFILLLVAISMGAAGQLMLKAGLSELPKDLPALSVLGSIFSNLRVFLGFVCYGLSSLVYLIALKQLPLSYAYPMVALSYVIVVVLSWRLFGEEISALRIGALVVILVGVVMLALSYPKENADADGTAPANVGSSDRGDGVS